MIQRRGKKERRRVPNEIRGRSRILGCERERFCNREVVNGRIGNLLSVVTDDRDLGLDQVQSIHLMNIVILEAQVIYGRPNIIEYKNNSSLNNDPTLLTLIFVANLQCFKNIKSLRDFEDV